jgi:hypothetical protein
MGWEYDGDEDAFNNFVNTNSSDDGSYSDNSEQGVLSH